MSDSLCLFFFGVILGVNTICPCKWRRSCTVMAREPDLHFHASWKVKCSIRIGWEWGRALMWWMCNGAVRKAGRNVCVCAHSWQSERMQMAGGFSDYCLPCNLAVIQLLSEAFQVAICSRWAISCSPPANVWPDLTWLLESLYRFRAAGILAQHTLSSPTCRILSQVTVRP